MITFYIEKSKENIITHPNLSNLRSTSQIQRLITYKFKPAKILPM